MLQNIIPPPVPRILLRTKADLDEEIPENYEIEAFMKKYKCSSFFSTSAKDGTGVSEAFIGIAKEIYNKTIKEFGMKE